MESLSLIENCPTGKRRAREIALSKRNSNRSNIIYLNPDEYEYFRAVGVIDEEGFVK